MADHTDWPFKAEYAKSGRSSCKTCKSPIGQETLRLAVMVQSPMFDGKIPNWNHYACFWKKNRVTDPQEIHGFESLRWDDQQKIKEKIGDGDGVMPGFTVGDFATEYAKSSRSTCRGCDEKIVKDEIRISKKDYSSQRAKMYGPLDMWYHVNCFVENRDDLGFGYEFSPESIAGFAKLQKEDKDDIIKQLGKGDKPKKRKGDGDAKGSEAKKAKKGETAEEKALKEQSQLIWSFRDQLQKHVSNDALRGLLEYNEQDLSKGESKLLDTVSDCLAFGALKRCSECKDGQLVYSTTGYKCTGNVTSWTKCMYITKNPERKAFKIPEEYNDVDFLKQYKYKKRDRVFPTITLDLTDGPVSSSLDSTAEGSSKPLAGAKFVIVGKTTKPKAALTKEISSMGGQVVSKVDSTVAACISTKDEVEKNSKGIKDAKKSDVHVVDEGILEACKKGGMALMIQQHSIAKWGSDPVTRIVEPSTSKKSSGKSAAYIAKRDEAMFTKNLPDKLKMTVKGGAAVDPDTGVADCAHVIQEKGEIYNAVLGLVDVVKGTNSYYKIQALEADQNSGRPNRWWLFRAWGRVGTTIGGFKLESRGSRKSAVESFKELYAEKTNNEWRNREKFVKYPNKFFPLEIDYGEDDDNLKIDMTNSKSKLNKAIQDIVQMIFDIDSMKRAMKEFEIDLKKMPLGKLSKRQIESAYSVLNELQKLTEEGGSQTKFLDASNRFYTLIPHDFGMKKMPMLDTQDIIKTKTEMLDNLLDIEVAYSLMKGGDGGEDPIDAHYSKLKTKMEVVDKKSDEFKRLVDYVKNTHATTHNQYDLEVKEAIKITREGEAERFSPFKELGNRKLLWHGSRTTNYAGILSQGLRIAPPEAPCTGYMFGKGIYFADMVSKSANYCRTSKADPIGLMLLCDVALGNTYELTGASYVTKLPKGKHSTKGIGMTAPDPAQAYVAKDGMEIPMGTGINLPGRSSLLYNEYIVYDVSQVSMKYLLKMDFKFKW